MGDQHYFGNYVSQLIYIISRLNSDSISQLWNEGDGGGAWDLKFRRELREWDISLASRSSWTSAKISMFSTVFFHMLDKEKRKSRSVPYLAIIM